MEQRRKGGEEPLNTSLSFTLSPLFLPPSTLLLLLPLFSLLSIVDINLEARY